MALGILFAFLAGGTVVLNRVLNADLGTRIGLMQSTVFNYITGLLASAALLLASREPLALPDGISPVMYAGGVIGVATVMLSNYAAPHISVFLMTLLTFVSQFAAGLVIDGIQGMSMPPLKILGGGFVLAGLALYVVGERRRARREG